MKGGGIPLIIFMFAHLQRCKPPSIALTRTPREELSSLSILTSGERVVCMGSGAAAKLNPCWLVCYCMYVCPPCVCVPC
ncbi:hypothetical protein LY76DRAFT_212345 [Colletotrichum caudatum]|nr:hypothetical protein LY76DRAFT_212345 [Colletotrichum caudatum]